MNTNVYMVMVYNYPWYICSSYEIALEKSKRFDNGVEIIMVELDGEKIDCINEVKLSTQSSEC